MRAYWKCSTCVSYSYEIHECIIFPHMKQWISTSTRHFLRTFASKYIVYNQPCMRNPSIKHNFKVLKIWCLLLPWRRPSWWYCLFLVARLQMGTLSQHVVSSESQHGRPCTAVTLAAQWRDFYCVLSPSCRHRFAKLCGRTRR